ncbi:hypothetical protein KFL_000350120 [Klebsormidium nitens]|uniref:Uncharacterized protein n=1 Tax=Klebsormidium nitens TaxID=105231 RepID=A0A1Y1HLZ0_KLENI|nr:hypothetical protein KFL_000350120 [Klebsormidium nitens]|eukprot:GAQ79655.1 hypothetical protein KFL_000350120 [Klebsormidium nitens]
MVSASHLATVKWLGELRVPFRTFLTDLDQLDVRGYALESDLRPVWFIEREAVTFSNNYGFHESCFAEFFQDVAQPGPGCKRVLALIATSPRVWTNGMTLFKQAAEAVTRYVPHGIAVVVCGRGIFVTRAALEPDPENLGCSADGCPKGFQRLFHRPDASDWRIGREVMMRQVNDVIQKLDCEYGLSIPFMVFGYNLTGRSVSLRALLRVLTHLAIAFQKGRHTADLRHTFMRGAGKTRAVRESNGFVGGVRILCVKEDYEVVKELFHFTAEVLRMTAVGPGQRPDVSWLQYRQYAPRYKEVLETQRPHARRSLGLDLSEAGVTSGKRAGKSLEAPRLTVLRAIWELVDRADPTSCVRRTDVQAKLGGELDLDEWKGQVPKELRKMGFLVFNRTAGGAWSGLWNLTPAGRAFCEEQFGSTSS